MPGKRGGAKPSGPSGPQKPAGLRPSAFVIHWNEEDLPAKVDAVHAGGLRIIGTESSDGARGGDLVKELEPDALVIWLSRLPSHGRVTANAIRAYRWGRSLPIVFVDGDPEPLEAEKMAKVKAAVPDAFFATPKTLKATLAKAVEWGVRAKAAAAAPAKKAAKKGKGEMARRRTSA
jgi:hypothetical protein